PRAGHEISIRISPRVRPICSEPMDSTQPDTQGRPGKRQAAEKLALGEAYGPGTHVVVDEAGRSHHSDTLTDYWDKVTKATGCAGSGCMMLATRAGL
ncbi:hypothetical protein ACIA76_30230, partial [Nocardia sp. NPDC051570]